MSALPKAVQAQIAKANRLAEDLVASRVPAAPPTAPAPPAPAAAAEPAAPPAPPAPAPAAPPAPVDWEHKFKVLQGKYNAEVPRLTRQIQEQEQRLRDMQTQLTSLAAGKSANAGAPAQPPQRRVKDEEINAFGPDLYDFIKRAAREELGGDIDTVRTLEQRLVKTEQTAKTVGDTVARSAVQQVHDLLDAEVPEWEAMNVDPTYLAWLQEVDPYTGQPRGRLLSQAYEDRDGPRVVAFFKGFKIENAAVQPPPAAPAAPAAPPQPAVPEVQLETLVAPGTPKAGPQGGAPSDAGKRVWNQADAQQLYRSVNEFIKKGKPVPKELRALEADLIRAQAEGRLKV